MRILSYPFLILPLLCLSSYASESHYENGKLIVGTHYSPPWSYKDCSGAEIDIIRLAFREKGIGITCAYSSYGRLVSNFKQKKLLFFSPIVLQEIKANKAYAATGFIKYTDVVASYKKHSLNISELGTKKFVAYQKASEYLGPKYREQTQQSQYYREMPGRESQLLMLQKKRIDYVVGEYHILRELSKAMDKDKDLKRNLILKKWDIRAASYDKDIIKKFNEGLEAIKKKGLIKNVFKEYNIID